MQQWTEHMENLFSSWKSVKERDFVPDYELGSASLSRSITSDRVPQAILKHETPKLNRILNAGDVGRIERDIKEDIEFLFDDIRANNFWIPEPQRRFFKDDMVKVLKAWYKAGLTYYCREDEKLKISGFLFFDMLGNYPEISPQFDDNLTEDDIETLIECADCFKQHFAKMRGIAPSFVPVDKYSYLLYCHEKLADAFKDNIQPHDKALILKDKRLGEEWKRIIDKLFFVALSREAEKNHQGVNMDYLTVIAMFLAIERVGLKKYFKTYTKIVGGFLKIRTRTFFSKKAFLDEL